MMNKSVSCTVGQAPCTVHVHSVLEKKFVRVRSGCNNNPSSFLVLGRKLLLYTAHNRGFSWIIRLPATPASWCTFIEADYLVVCVPHHKFLGQHANLFGDEINWKFPREAWKVGTLKKKRRL